MPNLVDLVQIIPPDLEEEPEDIFASAPGFLFPDDLRNQHGDPGSTIIYRSNRFGNLELKTADPESENERRLFSHYLWNAGLKMAELISIEDGGAETWSVKGETVLELGAGVGLGGIVATLAGAAEVVISDYPSPTVLSNIARNAEKCIPKHLSAGICRIEGHEWGNFETSFAIANKCHFSRVIAADCFWMIEQHVSLVKSMLHFLSLRPDATVFAVAGFHTGRANLAAFFDVAIQEGLRIEEIYEENNEGQRRQWLSKRDGGLEDHTERKKWLALARLKRNIVQ